MANIPSVPIPRIRRYLPLLLAHCTDYHGCPMEWGRPLYFCPVVSSIFYLFSFVSSPILSHHRLDVYHTSAHGVALVQIWDAGLKHAADGLLKIQDAARKKNRHLCTITQLCRALSSHFRN